MTKKVVAVVVTFNRRELLKRVIDSLKKQTIPLSKIIVINNGSTDGTQEWLDEQEYLAIIHQDNVGGSGGFHRGIQEAMKYECDWIWCMDDDVFPAADCLQESLNLVLSAKDKNIGIITPQRRMTGRLFSSECKKLNLSNPFRKLHGKALTEDDISKPLEIETMAFEGPLIRRDVVEKIGLPNKDLFILYDDTDYCYRCILAGYKVIYNPTSVFEKYCFTETRTAIEQQKANKWKLFYDTRNSAYFCHKYGKNILVRTFGGNTMQMIMSVFKNVFTNDVFSLSDAIKFIQMDYRGRHQQLGKM